MSNVTCWFLLMIYRTSFHGICLAIYNLGGAPPCNDLPNDLLKGPDLFQENFQLPAGLQSWMNTEDGIGAPGRMAGCPSTKYFVVIFTYIGLI